MGALDLIRSKGGGAKLSVEQVVFGRDAAGVQTRDWGPAGSPVDCWVQPAGAQIVLAYASRNLRITNRIFIAEDIGAVKEGWRLRVEKGGVVKHYLIRGGPLDEAGLGRVWSFDADEVQG